MHEVALKRVGAAVRKNFKGKWYMGQVQAVEWFPFSGSDDSGRELCTVGDVRKEAHYEVSRQLPALAAQSHDVMGRT